MIHMPLSERVGLLASRIPISIPILLLGTLIGVVPCLLAFEASDVTQIFLNWCRRVEMLLIAISSIAIANAMLVTMVVVSISSMMNVASMVMVIPSKLASA